MTLLNTSKILILLISLMGLARFQARAQHYHAVNGSSYAGVIGAVNNPASIGNSLHRWDVQLFSGQTAVFTNTILGQAIKNAALSKESGYLTNGFQSRNFNTNSDISFLSGMYRINKKHAVAVAIRGKLYNHIYANEFNIQDSISSINSFFNANRNTPFLEGKMLHAGWGEINLTYAGSIVETENSRLTVGATLQLSKSLSGAFSNISKLRFRENTNGIDTSYTIFSGVGEYGYSANYDVLQESRETRAAVKDFFKQSKIPIGLSIGFEYLQYDAENDLDKRNYDGRLYNYKIGLSIVDIGSQKFNNSEYTGRFSEDNRDITDNEITRAFRGVNNSQDLRDSMGTLFDSIQVLPATFRIGNPTRAILNFDKQIRPQLFVNAQMVIHLSNTKNSLKKTTNDYSFITITPRWENLNWGIYMPLQYTRDGQVWTGLAIKAGPFIGGIHRLGIFKQGSLLNGGGYIMLNIHPFRKKEISSRIDCFN